MTYSPPEQFAIIPLIPIHIGNLYLSFINSSLSMLPTLGLILLLVHLVTSNGGHLISNACPFLPPRVPLLLAPFLVLLEVISYCFCALSLGICLFANMMAGHSLVKISCGFAWTMLSMRGILLLAHLVPLSIVFALTSSKSGVAIS
ncbi:hypothetical protein KP509_07G077400 [Ceratopteris richardii]|uniref:F-ATPase protein 6 n=1 Tax=Ceratopteris richardii TaxID=49495 RepID=A0A8T2UG27_CERRI|nr:hypothetical protein KP509_07G077400 [Ceratopteris richardii]